MKQLLTILVFVLVAASSSAQADYDTTGLIRRRYYPPKAFLVMLPTGGTRRAYLEKIHDAKRTAYLNEDIRNIQQKMVEDYRDNFDYCPVYFFTDTNASLVKAQKFEGVLLDTNMRPVAKPVIAPGDTDYFVGYYGIAGVESTAADTALPDARKPNEETYLKSQNGVNGVAMHIMTYKLTHVVAPLPYTVNQSLYEGLMDPKKKGMRKYRYRSKYFDLSYTASAAMYNATLDHFYGYLRRH